ncbi:midasin isoform X1 [Tanacetum coccineum]
MVGHLLCFVLRIYYLLSYLQVINVRIAALAIVLVYNEQHHLGDLVHVESPEVGSTLIQDSSFGAAKSAKATRNINSRASQKNNVDEKHEMLDKDWDLRLESMLNEMVNVYNTIFDLDGLMCSSLEPKLNPEHVLPYCLEHDRNFVASYLPKNAYNFYKNSNASLLSKMVDSVIKCLGLRL